MLYPVVHDLRSPLSDAYAVVAAISGTPTSNVLRLERNVRGQRDWAEPVPKPVLWEVLAALGFSIEHLLGYFRPVSLGRFVHYNGPALISGRGAVIVHTPKVMAAIDAEFFVASSYPVPTPLEEWPRNWRVESAEAVRRISLPRG